MKILKIENNTAFGNNKQLNRELIAKLKASKENQGYMSELQRLNNYINKFEKWLRKIEDEGNMPVTVSDMGDVFVTLKSSFCDWISDIFPELKYASREYKSYKTEMDKRGIGSTRHWLRGITTDIEMTHNIEDIDNEMSKTERNKDCDNALLDDLKKMPGAEFVTEYVPTSFVKRGFAGLGGMNELKELLNERIIGFLKNPEQAKLDEIEYGIEIPKGILMYGPQGCGKTTIVEVLSVEAGVPLLKVSSAKTGSKYIHETSERTGQAFEYAQEYAKKIKKPVILMIDDADGLLATRGENAQRHHAEEMSTFLDCIQNAGENNVVVIAATNKYDLIDDAAKSRFEEQILILKQENL